MWGWFKQGGILVLGILRPCRPLCIESLPLSWILNLSPWALPSFQLLNRLLFPAKIQQLQPKPLHLFPLWPDLLGQLFLPIFSRSSPAVHRLDLALPESPAASCCQTWWALVRCTLPPSQFGASSSPACALTGDPCFPSSLASQPALASLLSLGVSPLPPPAPQSTLAPSDSISDVPRLLSPHRPTCPVASNSLPPQAGSSDPAFPLIQTAVSTSSLGVTKPL